MIGRLRQFLKKYEMVVTLYRKIKLMRINIGQTLNKFMSSLTGLSYPSAKPNGLQLRIQELENELAFYRTTEDFEIDKKRKIAIDGIECFGKADFADLTPWLFASSLNNHKVVHQRIDEASLLWKSVKRTKGPILEVGRAAGGSTLIILGASEDRQVDSIDRFPQHQSISDYVFGREDIRSRLKLYEQSSRDPIPYEKYGLLFIDGDHSYDGICHDIGVFWNRLEAFENCPGIAVFHDAADNPISFVEPVRKAVNELLAETNVAKLVGSWGSMTAVQKIGDIDETQWFSKIDTDFWAAYEPTTFIDQHVAVPLEQEKCFLPIYEGSNYLYGDNFDNERWQMLNIKREFANNFGADNPLRIFRQDTNLGKHALTTRVNLEKKQYHFSTHLRPLGLEKIRVNIGDEDKTFLDLVFTLANSGSIEIEHCAPLASVFGANVSYRNAFFKCEFAFELYESIECASLSIEMTNQRKDRKFTGDETKSFAINSANLREIKPHSRNKNHTFIINEKNIDPHQKQHNMILNHQSEGSAVRWHGSPYVVFDDLFSDDYLEKINRFWPEDKLFEQEILGSRYYGLYEKDLDILDAQSRDFWSGFTEKVGPAVVAKVGEKLFPFLRASFGNALESGITTHGAFLLMEQSNEYEGIGKHTHFYHNPNWVFTTLMYVGDDRGLNPGTSLHQIRFKDDINSVVSNYREDYRDECIKIACGRFDAGKPDDRAQYDRKTIAYRRNRVFAFADGPLALHEVVHQRSDGDCIDRQIIRAHVKVDFDNFLNAQGADFNQTDFVRVMNPWSSKDEMSPSDKSLREHIIRNFVNKRINEHIEGTVNFEFYQTNEDIFGRFYRQVKSYRP